MYYDETYLAHHGIKGQRWGIRRYQNADGTRTALGKRRDQNKINKEKWFKQNIPGGKDKPKISAAEKVFKESGNILSNSKNVYKTIKKVKDSKTERESKKLSDQELRDRINRLNLEKQYESLIAEDYERGHITANDILDTVGSVVSIGGSVVAMIALAASLKK